MPTTRGPQRPIAPFRGGWASFASGDLVTCQGPSRHTVGTLCDTPFFKLGPGVSAKVRPGSNHRTEAAPEGVVVYPKCRHCKSVMEIVLGTGDEVRAAA